MTELDKQDLEHIAIGATFLGSGGGGTLTTMLAMIETLPARLSVPLVSVEEAQADPGLVTCVCGFVGSQSAAASGRDVDPQRAPSAVEYFDRKIVQPQFKKPVGRVVPVEMGVQSSVIPAFIIAMIKGWSVVDADGAGRAVPALAATSYAAKLPVSAAAVADFTSLRMIVDAKSDADAQTPDIVALQQAIDGVAAGLRSAVAGTAMWAMDQDSIGKGLPIRGTLDLARKIGATLKEAETACASDRVDPVPEVLRLVRTTYSWAEVIFEGKLLSVDVSRPDYQVVTIASSERKVVVLTAGESTMAWDAKTGEPIAMAPDSICYVTRGGKTFSNTEVGELVNKPICLVGIAARDTLRRSPIVMSAFDWARAAVGYPGPHKPIEDLNGQPPATGWQTLRPGAQPEPSPEPPTRPPRGPTARA